MRRTNLATATRTGPNPERAYRPTRAEQETIICWDREDPILHLWSANPAVWRKAERLGLEVRKESHWPGGAVAGRWYEMPLAGFRWGRKKRGGKGNPDALAKSRVTRASMLRSVV